MYKKFIGWAKEPGKTETKYIIECIRDKKTWDKFSRTEDLDLYEKREYDNISDALSFYMTWFISDDCYDIKMWQQIFVNGELIFEEFFEPAGSVYYTMRDSLDKDMNRRIRNSETETKELGKSNELYSEFVKALGKEYEEMFKDFCRREK